MSLWMLCSLGMAAEPGPDTTPPPPTADVQVAPLDRIEPLDASQQVGPRSPSWARTTLHTGLGIAGVSLVGGAAGTGLVMARCSSASYQGHCFEALVPMTLGGAGVLLGTGTALVGGVGLLAMPKPGGAEVRLTARF